MGKYTNIQSIYGVCSGEATAAVEQNRHRYLQQQHSYRRVFIYVDNICEKWAFFPSGNRHLNVKYSENGGRGKYYCHGAAMSMHLYMNCHATHCSTKESLENVIHGWNTSVPSAHLDRLEYYNWINVKTQTIRNIFLLLKRLVLPVIVSTVSMTLIYGTMMIHIGRHKVNTNIAFP
jgi:hypothetical protein